MSITEVPIETLYKILLPLSSHDIARYCQTYSVGRDICKDKLFWKAKLDYDFMNTTPTGQILIPSQYNILYGSEQESGLDMYLRWQRGFTLKYRTVKYSLGFDGTGDGVHYSVIKNNDIIIFRLDMRDNDPIEMRRLYTIAIGQGDIKLMNILQDRGAQPSQIDMTNDA
jgi:hypothetical protein